MDVLCMACKQNMKGESVAAGSWPPLHSLPSLWTCHRRKAPIRNENGFIEVKRPLHMDWDSLVTGHFRSRGGIPGTRLRTSSVKENFIIILIKCSLIYLIQSFYNQPMLNLWSFYIQPVTNVNSILSIDTIHEFERIISLPLRNPATISLF